MGHRQRDVNQRRGERELTQDPRKLRRRRIAAGLTIRQLSQKAQVGIGSISDLEHGKQSARPGMLAALAKALGCEISDLMTDEDPDGRCDECGYLYARCSRLAECVA